MRSPRISIPILDIAKYHTHQKDFVEELRYACHNVGFFLIRTDLRDLSEQMLHETSGFSQRPLEEKLQISYEHNPSFRGYMQLGLENTGGKLDYREQIEYAVEYPTSEMKLSWPPYERLKGTNPWPEFQPSLRRITLEYSKQVCQVAGIIRDSLCLALQLDPKDMRQEKFEHPTEVPHWVLKLISYPPAPSNNDAAIRSWQGVGAHTDTNFLTMVLQNDAASGGTLQAFSQGEWIDVPSQNGSDVLICNLGEHAETWSRGYFLATPHRVVMRPPGESSAENQ
jgi:isopenicillin N synthase-like dioxygenase